MDTLHFRSAQGLRDIRVFVSLFDLFLNVVLLILLEDFTWKLFQIWRNPLSTVAADLIVLMFRLIQRSRDLGRSFVILYVIMVLVVSHDFIQSFNNLLHFLNIIFPRLLQLHHQVSYWNIENTYHWLIPPFEDVIKDSACQFRAVEGVLWKRNAEFHGGVDRGVWS